MNICATGSDRIFRVRRIVTQGLLVLAALLGPVWAARADGGNYVTAWNEQLLDDMRQLNRNSNGGDDPPGSARAMAITNATIFNTINAFDGGRHYEYYRYARTTPPPAGADRHAAVMRAAQVVLTWLYPTRVAAINN